MTVDFRNIHLGLEDTVTALFQRASKMRGEHPTTIINLPYTVTTLQKRTLIASAWRAGSTNFGVGNGQYFEDEGANRYFNDRDWSAGEFDLTKMHLTWAGQGMAMMEIQTPRYSAQWTTIMMSLAGDILTGTEGGIHYSLAWHDPVLVQIK